MLAIPESFEVRTAARLFLATIVLFAVSGCASTAALERRWIEASSPNFSVFTTLSDADARQLLEDLELFRSALLAVTKLRNTNASVPTEIYGFDASDYGQFSPAANIAGYFVPLLRTNMVALSANRNSAQARAILFHEYTHFLMNNEGRLYYPHWFNEGFADLLSSVDAIGAMVEIGSVPAHRQNWFLYGLPLLPYDRVIRADSPAYWRNNDVGMYYAQTWLLVHYLALGPNSQSGSLTKRMDGYVEAVARHVDKEKAFEDAFGLDFDELDKWIRVGWERRRGASERYPDSEPD